MEKLTSNRVYFDFNATSPLCEPVLGWLQKGDFSVCNPSSEHSSGRLARMSMTNAQVSIQKTLGTIRTHDIFWHSGATEAINTVVKSLALEEKRANKPFHYFYFESDHAAPRAQNDFLELLGFEAHALPISKNCDFDLQTIVQEISRHSGVKLLNFTWVNNETGVVWALELAQKIKEQTGALIHVDAVQAVGKIEDWDQLHTELDFYSYSGHKFGALKGIGFTLVKKKSSLKGLIQGGSQQAGYRSGTENPMGVESVSISLQYVKERFNPSALYEGKEYFENKLKEIFGEKVLIIGEDANQRNLNTIFAVFKEIKSDALVASMDMAGFDVGRGSACSSGLSTPNKTLLAIGLDDALARGAVRFSFSPFFTLNDSKTYLEKLTKIWKKFI